MNDGMYQAFRNYLEEIASQNKQILEVLKEIRLATNRTDTRLKEHAKEDDKPVTPKVPRTEPPVEGLAAMGTMTAAPAVPHHETTAPSGFPPQGPVEGLAGFAQPPAQSPKPGDTFTQSAPPKALPKRGK